MFGLSWDRIILILVVLVFVLGPERIPTAVNWAMSSLRKLRTMAAGAQAELRTQIGPELDELRRQVAELQSLKELQELRVLRELNPKNIIGKNILGDEFSGGISGFLGLNAAGAGTSSDGAGATGGAGAAPTIGSGPGAVIGGEAAVNGAVEASGTAGVNGHSDSANGGADTGLPRSMRELAVGEAPPIDLDAT